MNLFVDMEKDTYYVLFVTLKVTFVKTNRTETLHLKSNFTWSNNAATVSMSLGFTKASYLI